MKLEKLETLIGTLTTVWAGVCDDRREFITSISVTGKLEKHTDLPRYRIVNTLGDYAYFDPADIRIIAHKSEGFKDGSKTVIKIEIKNG